MKRLLLVSSGNPQDKRTWSGTEYSFYQQLKKYYEVDILVVELSWIKKLDKIRQRIMTLGRQHTFLGLLDSYCSSKVVERKLNGGKYDVAFVFGSSNIPFVTTDTPIVYYTDATTHVMQGYYWTFRQPLYWEANLIQRKCLQKSRICLAASQWAMDDMVDYFGTEREKCRVCRLGANVVVDDAPVVKEANRVNLVFVGVDWKRKGGDVAIEAFRQLKATDGSRDYRLHVIGSRPARSVNDEGITFYGFLDRNNPQEERIHTQVFREGDIFLLPTQAECAGIVFCEASAYGLPIVTYDTGGIGDYVVNGVNGYRLPVGSSGKVFAEKISEIVNSPTLRSQLGDGGKRLYRESLNWDAAGRVVREAIDSLLSGAE